MTLHAFSDDIVPVIQICLTAIGLSSLFLIWWQAKRTTRWNQVQSHHQFFKDTPSQSDERNAYDAAKKIGVNVEDPLDNESAKKIVENDDARFAVKTLLNDYEVLCSAVQIGTVSEKYAFSVDGTRVIMAYKIYKPFIDLMREKRKTKHAWIDLQKLALKWEARELALHEKRQKALEKVEEDLAKLEQEVRAKRVGS